MTDFFNNYNIFRTRYEVSGSREYKVGDKHFGQYFGVLFKQRIVSEIRRVPKVSLNIFSVSVNHWVFVVWNRVLLYNILKTNAIKKQNLKTDGKIVLIRLSENWFEKYV